MHKLCHLSRGPVLLAVFAAAFAVTAPSAGAITFTGSITATDATHMPIINPTTGGTCAAKNAASPTVANSTHYDAYALVNASASTQCVTVTYTASDNVFMAGYSVFNILDSTLGFLGSTVGSNLCGGTSGSFSFNAPPLAPFVVEIESCSGGTVATYTLNVTGTSISTPVTFRSVSATATSRGAVVRWRTGSELGTLGFNVYRAVHGRRVRVNKHLIRAASASAGHAYSFLDRTAPRTKALRYWIQVVNLDGSRRWYGPARVARRART
jgi:hypothetical protein